MISIIICSRTASISDELIQNIDQTIGIAYELVIIDNSNNIYSIFSAYNEGVKRSKYEVLCFMHDDINFKTNDWGINVLNRFNAPKIGAIGVAGSPYYAILPGAWWSGGYICQSIYGEKELAYQTKNDNALPVVVLDGLWFCVKKSLFSMIRFDDTTFNGFHFYDIDISLQIQQKGYKILSVYDILIQHSSGKLDTTWLTNALLLQNKWKNNLPIFTEKLSYFKEVTIEFAVLEEYIKSMKKNGINSSKILSFMIQQLAIYRLKQFKISFPFIFIYLVIRYLLKKLNLR
jgi:GT2 family glycosyltransferase